MQHQPRMTGADWGLLLVLSVLWGGSFFFVNVIVREVPPFTLVFARFGIATLLMWIYLRVCRLPVPVTVPARVAFTGMGLLNNLVPAALIAWSQTRIGSGLASILIATTPVFSILAAHWLTDDERLSANKVVGIALGIAGVAALVGTDALRGSGRSVPAILGCLAAAISYGFANVFGRRFRRMDIAPAVGAFGQLGATTVMVLPMALAFEAPWRLAVPGLAVWASLAGLSLVSTALAYVIFFLILGRAGGTNISLVTLLIPVSAILLGTLVLGERLLAAQILGMGLIGLGIIAIDGRVCRAVWPATR